jgi:shikimate dehydrogenase
MSRRAKLVGLVGANIMKSLSPALHEDAFSAHGIIGHYHLMDVDRMPGRRLDRIFEAARIAGFAGINVTFPFKQEIMPLLDEVAPDAREIGAVNTVTFGETGRAIGYNTDRSGFRRSVEEGLGRIAVEGRNVVLVGAGGAGRAVAFALMDLGAAHVAIHDVDAQRATATVADLSAHYGSSRASFAATLVSAMADADGVVNATPIGMIGMPGSPVPHAVLHRELFVADVIYTPMETELICAARRLGCRVLTGGGMCVHQAADAFRLFSGLEPDVARMHLTFERALVERDAALRSVA